MKLATLTVHSGWHRRRWCPVSAALRVDEETDLAALALIDAAEGRPVPAQAWRDEDGYAWLAWIIHDLPPHQERTYELLESPARSLRGDGVELRYEKDGTLAVYIAGDHLTTYNYGAEVVRPYLYPVYSSGGVGVTRNWPMVPDAPGETTDHPHHKGIYTAQGDVNGVDNWGEGHGHGYQIHREFTRVFSGPVAGGFTEHLDWTDAERTPNLSETRRLTFYATPARVRLFDYEVTFAAAYGPVTMGDTKEGGFLSVRVATSMDATGEPDGGRFVNGVGSVLEEEAWGKRAPWCDYSGPTDGGWRGIAFMDHTDNPRHPTHWHVRNYGLMTANPVGLHDFTGDPDNRWDLTIAEGESITFRYRVMIHDGDAGVAQVADRYQDFVHPPKVVVA